MKCTFTNGWGQCSVFSHALHNESAWELMAGLPNLHHTSHTEIYKLHVGNKRHFSLMHFCLLLNLITDKNWSFVVSKVEDRQLIPPPKENPKVE